MISYISDSGLEKEFAKDVRMRNVDQKFFYIGSLNAEYYYNTANKNKSHLNLKFSDKECFDFLKKQVNTREKNVLISLGCGNAGPEKGTLREIAKNNFNFDYVGVDISTPMLNMAQENLKNIKIKKNFIQADFSEESFILGIADLTKDYDKKIVVFGGGTLGNVNQTNIADILYNLLSDDDILLIEVLTRPNLSLESDMKIFNRYAEYIEDEDVINFFFLPLKKIGIPFSSGKIILKTVIEKSVGALLFSFYFKLKEKVVITLRGEKIHLLPDEEIKLPSIRVYQSDTLIKFFEEHDFTLIDRQAKCGLEQIMFKK
ncbi:MAG: L-histidine N(alpha)-methyltransferase [Candidatus Pacebacteria bacterium]|nr:L-histidine N(alpha)-methyltransferase [Candidatus Paceibacterota bacterium]